MKYDIYIFFVFVVDFMFAVTIAQNKFVDIKVNYQIIYLYCRHILLLQMQNLLMKGL